MKITKADAYKDLVDALAILTESTNRLAMLEAEMQEQFIDLMDDRRKEYTILQTAVSHSEQTIRDIATMNPQWFEDVKTVTTPYGAVQSRTTTALEVANEEVTIALLQQLGADAAPFLRVKTELNLEALESLPDTELARIRVARVTTEKITAKPAKVNLGSAAKASAKKAAAAAAEKPRTTC